MTDRYVEHRAVARNLGVDAIALVPGFNFERLFNAGFSSHERPMLVIVPVDGAPVALVPNLELLSFDALRFEGAVFDWRDQTGYTDAFAAMAAHFPLTSLAVEGQVMRVFVHHALAQAYPGLRIVDAEKQISGLRLCKTPAEVAALTRAIRLSEAALAETVAAVRVGMTEKQVEALLVAALFRHGADDLAFGPIVAAGGNAAMPHAHARDVAIQPGDALLIDFGGRKDGFAADITRTFFVGHADDRAHQIYDTVLRANLAGLDVTRAGVTAHAIDDAATSVLEASPFADYIRTKTGHGLGRAVHEAPYIMRGNPEVLAAGTVYTNEPGLYLPNEIGVRIEDDVLVTDAGYDLLTSFSKTLTVIG
jgi:Xaa-Pro dipeptidase